VSMDAPPEDLPIAIVVPPHATGPAPRAPAAGVQISWRRAARIAVWILVALPALYQVSLLVQAIAGRVLYPYDLEWMEGGMLHHALRIRDGQGIYVPPNIDFIPYLYTPLYPTLLALFGGPFGISYALGRVVSIIGLAGIAGATLASLAHTRQRNLGSTAAGAVLALGLFAACYPFVEGWYDLVRADTFFLFMVTAGIAGIPLWARSDRGLAGQGKAAAGAALFTLAFFCKQTGIFYVAFGGLVVLVVNWRRAPIYAAMAAVLGLGGTWLLNHSTHGWFWTYVSEIHRAHDFNMDRFYASFRNILWHFPAPTIIVAATLILVAVTARRTRHTGGLPQPARPFVLWSSAFAVSTLVGAIGWGTEFAHFNAYMPALLHGSIAAGAAVPAVVACVRALAREHRHTEAIATGCALAAAVPLAITCLLARWQPQRFIPTAADAAAGGRLIERLKSIDGDLWMPSHPWYLVLAGKAPHAHRMGIKDVTARQPRTVDGLDDKLRDHAFAAIVLDNRDLHLELPALRQAYRPAFMLPKAEQPRVYTGADVKPEAIWIPAIPATPPPNAKVVFDFEAATWADGWTRSGAAWGQGPVAEALPGQDLVLGATGARFATSMTGGDAAIGRVTSPVFALDGAKLTLRLGGGVDAAKLRVELWVDDALARRASVPAPGGDPLRTVTIELGELRGKQARLVLVDDAPSGHLNIDDVWLWR
jgi:hypothetical protein